MPMFKLNRTYALSSKLGHALNFIKGEAIYVPPALVNEVVALGAECTDGEVNVLGDEVTPVSITQAELLVKLNEVFAKVVAKNDPDEFTAQGVPKVTTVEAALGMKVSKSEVIDAWQRYRAEEGV